MKKLLKELNKVSEFFNLEKGWDDEDADPLDPRAYNRAMAFMHYLLVQNPKLKMPSISMMSHGGLSIFWSADNKETDPSLLIDVHTDKICWYGDEKSGEENSTQSKDETDSLQLFHPELIKWINKNLTEK